MNIPVFAIHAHQAVEGTKLFCSKPQVFDPDFTQISDDEGVVDAVQVTSPVCLCEVLSVTTSPSPGRQVKIHLSMRNELEDFAVTFRSNDILLAASI